MQALTEDPITKKVKVQEVIEFYEILSPQEQEKEGKRQEVTDYLKEVASYQDGCIVPGDLSRSYSPLKDT